MMISALSRVSRPVCVWTVAAALVLGCSSSSRARFDAGGTPDGALSLDAGLRDAPPDAAVEAGPDASIDAGVDAPPLPGIVTVHVFGPSDGRPSIGTRVLFAGPNDELIADVVTDEQGHASAHMAAGYVTVIRPFNIVELDLTTVLGVKEGETIEFGKRARDTTELGTVTVVPPPLSSGAQPWVIAPCPSLDPFGLVRPVIAEPACREHVGILAGSSAMDPPLYSYLADQTLTPGAVVQMPAWQPMANLHVALPDRVNGSNVQLSPSLFEPHVGYSASPRGVGAFDLNFWWPAIGGDVLFWTTLTRSDDRFIGKQEVFARAVAADEISFKMADLTARWLHGVIVDDTGPSPVLRWRQEGGDTGTVGWISARYTSRTHAIRWDIVGAFVDRGRPPRQESTGSYMLPQLPDPRLRIGLSSDVDAAQVRILAVNPEVTYDQLRPTIAGLLAFEFAWLGDETLLVDFRSLIRQPNVRVVRFSGSR